MSDTASAQRPPRISIVVPTLNEREFLPVLVESIEAQEFDDYEIVVADAGSQDGTQDYAREHGCRVVEGGMPARGRNAGAAAARGQFLFFLDSDVRLPPGFFSQAMEEIDYRFADLATCEARPITEMAFDKLLFSFASTVTRLTVRTQPRATGFCIIVTKRLFDRVGGFDESIKLGEDHAFSKAAAEFRPLEFLTSTYIEVSVRRLEKEGRIAYMLKALHSDVHRRFVGEIRDDLIDYEFAHYDQAEDEQEHPSVVAKLDRWLLKADEGLRTLLENNADYATTDTDQDLGEKLQEQLQQIESGFRRRMRRRDRRDRRDRRKDSNSSKD